MKISLLAALAVFALPLLAADDSDIKFDLATGQLQVEPSFQSCSYYFRPAGSSAAPYVVEFRRAGDEPWQRAFEPVTDKPAGIWKGSLFDLTEDTAWQVRVVNGKGAELISPVAFRTWTSHPKIAKVIDLSTVAGAAQGLVITDQGTPDGWIKYTAPRGWRIERANDLNDAQQGAITLRNARYIILENLTIVGGSRYGVQVDKSESVRILNCDISGWGRLGEQQYTNTGTRGKYADANGELINYDAGVKIDGSARTVVERCYLHDPRHRSNSWQYSHPSGPCAVHANSTLGGTVLRWNDFIGSDEHRWNDVIESSSNSAANGGFFRDSDISGNFLAFGNDDGVELEGGGMNVRFYGNKIEGTTCGISTGACILGPQFIYGNLVANPGDETGLALMFFKNSHGVPQGGKRHFVNNTLFGANCSAYGNYGKPIGSDRIGFMRNNVFFINHARLPGETSRRDDFDGDLFWVDKNEKASQDFLGGFHQIGQEAHGVAANPEFVAAVQGDFHLTSNSPGRGRALGVEDLVRAGANLGAFADEATEVPYRPLALTAAPRQLNFLAPGTSAQLQVRLNVPAAAKQAVPFEIRQNRVFSWFKVEPASGTVAPGESLTLTVTVDPAALVGRPLFKGAFLVRTPSGLSRPVTVYAVANFQENLRPAEAPNTAYIEVAEIPGAKPLVRETSAPGVFGGKYLAFAGDGAGPEIPARFVVAQAGRYSLLVRASVQGDVMKRRDFTVSLDGAAPEKTAINTDYEWNTGATRFRAVYLFALGELKPGPHELRVAVQGEINLNELIITDTPSAFSADGWQKEKN